MLGTNERMFANSIYIKINAEVKKTVLNLSNIKTANGLIMYI